VGGRQENAVSSRPQEANEGELQNAKWGKKSKKRGPKNLKWHAFHPVLGKRDRRSKEKIGRNHFLGGHDWIEKGTREGRNSRQMRRKGEADGRSGAIG